MEPIATTVLTGFLGSGKTTLLNQLLAHTTRKLAVIVNEFGAVGVDGQLVAGGDQFVQLDNGCLCCALNEDLNATLVALRARGGFDHLVIETTGMADPLPVAWSFNKPDVSRDYRVDAIVTVVDAVHFGRALAEAFEARQQVLRADLLLVNKVDLVADVGAAATELVRAHNTLAPLFVCGADRPPPWDLLLSHGGTQEALAPAHAHHASFATYSYVFARQVSDRALEDFMLELPENVYRLKGLVHTDAGWDWTLVNVVAGRMDMRPFTPVRPGPSALVFIGRALDEAALTQRCEALMLPP